MSTGQRRSARHGPSGVRLGARTRLVLIGLGAGALAGLLLAPKSGKLLRKDLKRGYDDALDTVGDWADEAKDRVGAASDRVREVASRSAEIAEDLRDTVREKTEPLRRVINRS